MTDAYKHSSIRKSGYVYQWLGNVDMHMLQNWIKIYRVDQELLAFPLSDHILGRVAQSVTCQTTDASLTADPGVASSILTRSHTFVQIDYEN